MAIPLKYNIRSLVVRRTGTFMAILSVAATVAVFVSILALAAGLESAGFKRTDPAVFVWLGVVFYLTPNAVHTTLEYIAGQAQPVEVVFDYLQPAATDEDRAHQRARADRLAGIGEPLFSYFAPGDIAAHLHALGFTGIEDHSAPDLIAGYLHGSAGFEGEPPRALHAIRILHASRASEKSRKHRRL